MTLDELLLEWSYRSEKGYPCMDSPSDISLLKEILEEFDLPANEIIDNLGEVKLTPGELKGTIKHGPFKSEKITRQELLIRKIENDEEFELIDGSTITVANKEEVLAILKAGPIGAAISLEGTNGEKSNTSLLYKTHEFGSSKAHSGSTDPDDPIADTPTKEGLVILMCNVLKGGGTLTTFNTPEDYTNNFKTINDSKSKYQDIGGVTQGKIEDLFNLIGGVEKPSLKAKHILNNPYSIALEIFKEYPNAQFIEYKKGGTFDEIRRECSKITGLPDDKWNPGDIYLKNSEPKLPEDKDSIVPWNDLFVHKWGDTDAPLVSISLKEEKHQLGRAKSYLAKFGGKEIFNIPKKDLMAMTEKELKNGIENFRKLIRDEIELKEDLKFEEKGSGWNSFPNTDSQLRAKFGCYKLLNFLLNRQNNSSILGLFAYGLSIDRDERANPTFFKLVGGNKGEMIHKIKYPAGVNSDMDENTPIVLLDEASNGNIKISGTIIKTDGDDFNEKEETFKTLRLSGDGQVQIT